MRSAAPVVLLFLAGTAQADPGHGIATLWHLLTEPDHLAMILLPTAAMVGVLLARRRRARLSKP